MRYGRESVVFSGHLPSFAACQKTIEDNPVSALVHCDVIPLALNGGTRSGIPSLYERVLCRISYSERACHSELVSELKPTIEGGTDESGESTYRRMVYI
jgi:hypothetical protein